MNLTAFLRKIEKISIDNSPTILTTVGVVGTIGTAVLTHKAATRAERLIEAQSYLPDRKAVIKLVWKEYIPPVAAGAFTVSAIVLANRIGTKRAAAMAAAYTISEKAFEEYRSKVVKHVGANREEKIRDEIAQDRVDRRPVSKEVIIAGSGDVLCFDAYSGRYFNSTMENLKRAMNDINRNVIHQGYASLSDFYEQVGLPATEASEEVGWNADKVLDLEFSTVLSEDGRPGLSFSFFVTPVRNYFRFDS